MKKMILTFVFCSLCFFITQAQKFHGGLFAGVAASQISGDNLSGFNKPGVFAGAFTNIFFKEKYGLELELYYVQKGSRKIFKNDYSYTYKLNLQYFEMPILFKFKFFKRFYLEAGPALGVLIKNTGVEKDGNGLVPNSQRPAFNRLDYSALGGLGFRFARHFLVDLRAQSSFIPVRKPQPNTTWHLDRWQYNSSIIISFIYEI